MLYAAACIQWQGKKDSNLCMPESKSGALTSLAIPLHNRLSIATSFDKSAKSLFYLEIGNQPNFSFATMYSWDVAVSTLLPKSSSVLVLAHLLLLRCLRH